MLAIVVAMEREARIVRRSVARAGLESVITVSVSGIGPLRARAHARALVAREVNAFAVIGLAGALVDGLAAGDLVLPHAVCDEEGRRLGASGAPGLDQRLAGVATVHTGLVASVSSAVGDPAARRALARVTGAIAVDMESSAIAEVAHAAGLPWTVLRSVSDGVERIVPRSALRGVDGHGRIRAFPLAASLARRPWELADLVALGRDVRRAERSLASALDATLPALCAAVDAGVR